MMPANSAPCSKNARNLAFAAAASASSWRSRCSACRWRVTSRTIFDAPTTVPASSLIGEMVSETRMRLAVAPQPLGLEVFDPLSGLQAGDDLVLFGDAVGGDDQGDVAADGLLGGVAEQPLGAGVPALDDAVQRLADDGIVGGLDDRCEQAGGQQLAGPVALDAPLLGDVTEDQHAAGDGAVLVP